MFELMAHMLSCIIQSQVLKVLPTTCKDSDNEEHGSGSRAELQCLRALCLNDTSPLEVQYLVSNLNCTEIALFYPPLYLLSTSSSSPCDDS